MPDIPGNSSTTVSIMVDGAPVSNELETIGDHDWVRIELVAGQKITISVDGITLQDSLVAIRNSAGALLAENDDISSGVLRDSRLVFTATTSGTYYIDVGAYDNAYTGTYQLTVDTWTPPPVADLVTIATHLTHGYWGGESHRFNASSGGTITYDFNLAADSDGVTAAGQVLANEALALWSDITGITFVQVASGGQITFSDNESGAFATSQYSGGVTSSANVNISTQWLTSYGTTIGSYSFQTYVHEIGHALGLGHGGFYNGDGNFDTDALFANDGWPSTVMSYFDQDESSYYNGLGFTRAYVVTPMLADIRAVGALYGLSTTTRTGDTTYGFGNNSGRSVFTAAVGSTITALTIFDSGGIDTLNYSGFSSDQTINLNAETFSNVGGGIGNVSIGFGTIIENAIGGNGSDYLIGNSAANSLTGGGGFDLLTGGAGNDRFRDTRAGLNTDTITDFSIGDVIIFSDADINAFSFTLSGQVLTFTGGVLTLNGGVSGTLIASTAVGGGVQLTIQTAVGPINGTSGNDVLTGTSAGETINGLGGNDTLTGGAGVDTLTGGTGNDTFRDTAAGLNGDTITDFATGDAIVISDATLAGFTFSLSGNTLTYTGGSLILTGGVSGTLAATAAASGGVQLTIQTVVGPIDGTAGNDTLNGTTGNDTINGLDGNDVLNGGAGNDVLNGGAGSDTLIGGAGVDTLTGGTGNDTFRDTAAGLNGDTITDFATGDRILITNASLTGFTFSLSGNTLTYTGGSLILTGGVSGTLVASAAPGGGLGVSGGVQLTIQTAVGPIDGTAGNDSLNGTTGNDTINGLDGNDVLNGGAGNDVLNGGTGSDTLIGGAGVDTLTGGTGNDTFRDTAAGLNGDTITDFATGDAIVISDATLAGFTFSLSGNTLTYTGGSLILTGGVSGTLAATAAASGGVQLTIQTVVGPIDGTAGNDSLNGTTGNDTINGLDGNDVLNGGAGNDVLNGGAGSDTLIGGAGVDTLTGGTGNDTFRDTAAGLNGDTITDFATGDAIVISDATLAGFTFSLSGNTLTYTGGSLILTGGVSGTLVATAAASGGVQLTIQTVVGPIDGTAGNDSLNGTTGNDTINGLDGNDVLNGGAGNDVLNGGTGSDTLIGGAGVDTLTGGTGNDTFRDTAAGLNGDTITDFATGDAIVISDATLAGFTFSLSGNTLTYTGGSLILTGGVSGTLVATAAASGGVQLTIQTVVGPIDGTAGNDSLNGTTGNDTINGLDGNDVLNGGTGNDVLNGGTGSDTLIGGAGVDTLTGGTGNDTFRDTAAGLNGDTITDFATGDRILITNASLTGFTFSLSGNTLTYTGGSLTLTGSVSGTLVASAAPGGGLGASGGVQLTIQTATAAAIERIAADEEPAKIVDDKVILGTPSDDSFVYEGLVTVHGVGHETLGIIDFRGPADNLMLDVEAHTIDGEGASMFVAPWTTNPSGDFPNIFLDAVSVHSWVEADMNGGRYHFASGDFCF